MLNFACGKMGCKRKTIRPRLYDKQTETLLTISPSISNGDGRQADARGVERKNRGNDLRPR